MHGKDDQQVWRDKYYSSLEAFEKIKKDYEHLVIELRRDLSRVSLIGNGIDPTLDEYLRALRKDITDGAERVVVRKRIEDISTYFKSLPEQVKKSDKNSELLSIAKQLIEPFLSLKVNDAFSYQVRAYAKSIHVAEKHEQILQLLRNFVEVLNTYLEISGGDERPVVASKGLFSKLGNWFNHDTSNAVPEAPQANLAKFSLAAEAAVPVRMGSDTTELHASPTEAEIQEIGTTIIKLLDVLEFPDSPLDQINRLKDSLEKTTSLNEFSSVLKELVDLIQLAINKQREKFENFLEQMNGRLGEVQGYLHLVKEDTQQMEHGTEAFDFSLREQIVGIRSSFSHSSTLDQLQSNIYTKLDEILQNVGNYKESQNQKMQKAMQTISEINRRLADTEVKSQELQKTILRQKAISRIDPVTKLANRAAYDEKLIELIDTSRNSGTQLTLLMGDIDHFKTVNDTYGHTTGDQVLRVIGKIFQASLKTGEFAARFGGEEIIVILPGVAVKEGQRYAEKLRQRISEWRFSYQNNPVHVTMSFGITELLPEDTAESFFARVDELLYRAKGAGRNQVVVG